MPEKVFPGILSFKPLFLHGSEEQEQSVSFFVRYFLGFSEPFVGERDVERHTANGQEWNRTQRSCSEDATAVLGVPALPAKLRWRPCSQTLKSKATICSSFLCVCVWACFTYL